MSSRARFSGPVPVVASGLVGAAVVAIGRLEGPITGWGAVALAAALVIVVPSAKQLAPRLFVNLLLVFGWSQVLWWIPVGRGSAWHATAVLALCVGVLTGWVVRDRRARLPRLLPRVRPVDLAPFAVGVFVSVLYWPLLAIRDAQSALVVLLSGWDNVNHFAMVREILTFGTTGDLVPPNENGIVPAFMDYPQAFHATVATLLELWSPQNVQRLDVQVLGYQKLAIGLVLGSAFVLAAGVCSIPRLRRRPLVAAALSILGLSSLLLGMGVILSWAGFHNFLVASVLVASVALAAMFPRALAQPAVMAAAGGAIMAVAHDWILLAPLAVVALLPAISRRTIASAARRRLVASGVLLALAALGALRAIPIILSAQQSMQLTANVPSRSSSPVWVGIVVVTFAVASFKVRGRARRLFAVAALGVVMVVALGGYQFVTAGSVTYYARKLWTGLDIALVAILPVVLSHFVRPAPPQQRKALGIAIGLAVCVAVAQIRGLVFQLPTKAVPALVKRSEVTAIGGYLSQQLKAYQEPARRLIAATYRQHSEPQTFFILLDPPPKGAPFSLLANTWVRTLTNTQGRTTTFDYFDDLPDVLSTPARLVEDVKEALLLHPDTSVLVPPDQVGAIRAALDAEDADRVQTWDSTKGDALGEITSHWAHVR